MPMHLSEAAKSTWSDHQSNHHAAGNYSAFLGPNGYCTCCSWGLVWHSDPGYTLRLFDVNSKEWSIYWAAGTSGILDVPVVGKFKDGVGEFYSQEVFEGRHIFCRFTWSKITANSAQWEQAFSIDGGKTWETNWVNTFERVNGG